MYPCAYAKLRVFKTLLLIAVPAALLAQGPPPLMGPGQGAHEVILNNRPWARTYVNRATYVHPYTVPRYAASRRVEGHRLEEHRHDGRRR